MECQYFLRGDCKFGNKCRNLHSSNQIPKAPKTYPPKTITGEVKCNTCPTTFTLKRKLKSTYFECKECWTKRFTKPTTCRKCLCESDVFMPPTSFVCKSCTICSRKCDLCRREYKGFPSRFESCCSTCIKMNVSCYRMLNPLPSDMLVAQHFVQIVMRVITDCDSICDKIVTFPLLKCFSNDIKNERISNIKMLHKAYLFPNFDIEGHCVTTSNTQHDYLRNEIFVL